MPRNYLKRDKAVCSAFYALVTLLTRIIDYNTIQYNVLYFERVDT